MNVIVMEKLSSLANWIMQQRKSVCNAQMNTHLSPFLPVQMDNPKNFFAAMLKQCRFKIRHNTVASSLVYSLLAARQIL